MDDQTKRTLVGTKLLLQLTHISKTIELYFCRVIELDLSRYGVRADAVQCSTISVDIFQP